MNKIVWLFFGALAFFPLDASADSVAMVNPSPEFAQEPNFGGNVPTQVAYVAPSVVVAMTRNTTAVLAALAAATQLSTSSLNGTNGRQASLGTGENSVGGASGILRGMVIKTNPKETGSKVAYDFKFKNMIPKDISAASTDSEVVAIYKLTDGSPIDPEICQHMLAFLANESTWAFSKDAILNDIRKGVDPKSPFFDSLTKMVESSNGILSGSNPRPEQILTAVKSYNDVINSANLLYLSQPPESFLAYQFIYTIFTTNDSEQMADGEALDAAQTEEVGAEAAEVAPEAAAEVVDDTTQTAEVSAEVVEGQEAEAAAAETAEGVEEAVAEQAQEEAPAE